MKILKLLSLIILAVSIFLIACNESKDSLVPIKLEDRKMDAPKELIDRFSYMNGYEFGFYQKFDSVVINFDYFMQGYFDAFSGKDAMLDANELELVKQEWMEFLQNKRDKKLAETQEKMRKLGEQIIERDQKFVAEMRQKPGYTVQPSGLIYKIIEQGGGKIPTNDDFVRMHVVVKLTDGTIIDSTYGGRPHEIPVQVVYPGWNEALRMMPEGSIWELIVPPHLGFRELGFGDKIPPHAALQLKVELIKILEGEELETAIRNFMMMTNPGPGGPGGPGGTRHGETN